MTSVSVVDLFFLSKKLSKMKNQRSMKRVFMILLIIGFVVGVLQVLNTQKEVPSDLWKYSDYYSGNEDLLNSKNLNTANDLTPDVFLRDELPFPRSNAVTISLQKPSTGAKCGYDVRYIIYC